MLKNHILLNKLLNVENLKWRGEGALKTQSLHRAMQIYTESTHSDFGSIQSLHRVMEIYTESIQSNVGEHRVYIEQF